MANGELPPELIEALMGSSEIQPRMPEASFPEPSETAPVDSLTGQEPIPSDFWSRMAQGGLRFGRPDRITSRTGGGGLAALLGLLGAAANLKMGQAQFRMNEVEQRNQRLREAATMMGKERQERRRQSLLSAQNRANFERTADLKRELATTKPKKNPIAGVDTRTGRLAFIDPETMEAIDSPFVPTPRNPMVGSDPSTGDPVFFDPTTGRPRTGGVDPAKPRRVMPESTRKQLVDGIKVINQTNDIVGLFKPEFVGPAAGRVGSFEERFAGGRLAPGEAEFRSAVSTYVNEARNQIYGSALTLTEKDAAAKQFPDPNQPSQTFKARLAITEKNVRRAHEADRKSAEAIGFDLTEFPVAGEGASGGQDPAVEAAWQEILKRRARRGAK